MPITIKSEREIELMTEAGRILGIVHKELEKALKPGMSTLDIDALGEEVIRSYGCEPSFLNYNGYPASICVSVNDEIVHGIPSAKHLIKEGDIVSLDAGVIYKGYHSDAARTHAVGEVRPDLQKLKAIIYMIYPEQSVIMRKALDTVLSGNCADMESGPVFMNHRRFRISRCEEEDRS